MTTSSLFQFLLFFSFVVLLAIPLSRMLSDLFWDEPKGLIKKFLPLENLIYRITGVRSDEKQDWLHYMAAVIVFNALGGAVLFLILMHQDMLPFNPQHLTGLKFDLAFNIAASFVTNTNWQSYSGETTLSYLSQMAGLTVQNFLSAATGTAVALAVTRGFIRREATSLGNFYVDITRLTLYVFIPLSALFAIFLITQGVPDNFNSSVHASTLEGAQQIIPQGPIASQIAIKILGSNGGGYFNANASHPYENPNPLSNFVQLISILLLPVSLVLAFGRVVRDQRQGWALFACMTILFVSLFALCFVSEVGSNPHLAHLGVDQTTSDNNPGGNMEGKEVRFGIFNSSLWAAATTATSNGSVIAAHDSFTPLGGFVPLFNILVGEVIYGGVGCGLYGILIYVLIAVFVAGLMVGRTPEYLGKKIDAHEIKLAVLAQILYPVCVLGFGVISLLHPLGVASLSVKGPHGLSQMIYAYASAAGNNGSAFAGFNGNTLYQNIMLGIVMLLGRFGIIIPVLAIAGSLAKKKIIPPSSGTFPTHSIMFVILLMGVIFMFGGLTYFPTLALGPIAEHLAFYNNGGF